MHPYAYTSLDFLSRKFSVKNNPALQKDPQLIAALRMSFASHVKEFTSCSKYKDETRIACARIAVNLILHGTEIRSRGRFDSGVDVLEK